MSAIRSESLGHARILETAPARALRLSNEAATARVAERLAHAPGIEDAFITLHGPLGAGKTTFVRHLLRALGVAGRIKSPTYAVVEPHLTPAGLAVSHFDFYRFDEPREWEDAGFRDLFGAPGLKLAEWPEKAAGVLPVADLALSLALLHGGAPMDSDSDSDGDGDGARQLDLHAATPRGAALLEAMLAGEEAA